MKNILLVLVVATVGFSSCDKKEKTITESMMHAKVDSIVGTKLPDINNRSIEDLDRRLAIEVKPKADSIVSAMEAKMKKDSVQKKDIHKADTTAHKQ